MKTEALMKWFAEELLPSIVENGKFSENGERQSVEKCEFEATENFVSNFASVPCFARLHLRSPSGTTARDILIKFQSQNPLFRERMRTVPQYHNEVTLYNEVYPNYVTFLKSKGHTSNFIDRIMPKSFFASTGDGDPEKAVLVMEDLRKHGFRLSDSPVDLDLKHCLKAVESLARFHAISFAMKFENWKPFEALKNSFAEVFLEDNPECREQCEDFQGYISHRGIDYLLNGEASEVPRDYLEAFRGKLKPIFELLRSLEAPREPLAVIRHGDFNRNNIFFKYFDGDVVDAKLIDFQRVSYGSPSLDLGFLMYMNMSQEFREQHFNRVFEHYYSSLVGSVSEILKESEKSISDRIPIQAFREDFRTVAISHYVTVAFFLPVMLVPAEFEGEFEWEMENLSAREMAERNYKKGGSDVSKRISDVIVDFYRRKFYM